MGVPAPGVTLPLALRVLTSIRDTLTVVTGADDAAKRWTFQGAKYLVEFATVPTLVDAMGFFSKLLEASFSVTRIRSGLAASN